MHKPALTLVLLTLLTLPACQSPTDLAFAYTGEEQPLSQARGLAALAANLLHPPPRTAPNAPIAHAGVNPFGVNVFLEQEVEEAKRERTLQMIAAAGFHWIRQEFPWEDIEIHGKGDYTDRRNDPAGIDAWAKYDNIVALAEQYDLEIIARLSNPPAWTRALTDAIGTFAPPDDLADWGDYVYAVVSRYRGRIRYYQLWNEPNIYPEWGEQPVDPEGYTRLLCEGYRRAKEADPDVVIISGALAPTVSLHPGPGAALGMNDLVFLQRMYDAGAGACFDILAVNDYMLWSASTDHRLRPLTINFSRPLYIRDIMVANGDAGKPIWIGEMNANALPPNHPANDPAPPYGRVTLEQQARYAVMAYQRAMEEWPWVGVVNFWFFKRPSDAEQDQPFYYFRMVEPDFTPMPVYEALRDYITTLTPTLYVGCHQEDHWALAYDDGWTHQPAQGTQAANRPGATLRFWFEGASLTLQPGPGRGEIEVRVDGGAPRRIALEGQPVRLARFWRASRHEVALAAVSGSVSIDGFLVHSPTYPWAWIAAALPAVGMALWLQAKRRKR